MHSAGEIPYGYDEPVSGADTRNITNNCRSGWHRGRKV